MIIHWLLRTPFLPNTSHRLEKKSEQVRRPRTAKNITLARTISRHLRLTYSG